MRRIGWFLVNMTFLWASLYTFRQHFITHSKSAEFAFWMIVFWWIVLYLERPKWAPPLNLKNLD